MAVKIGAFWDVRRARRKLRHIKNGYPLAIAGAANRTAREMKTDASKRIRTHYNIKAKDIKEFITINKASKSNLSATVTFKKTDRPSLRRFGLKQLYGRKKRLPRQSNPMLAAMQEMAASGNRRKGAGVSYKIEKGGARRKVKEAFGADVTLHPKLHGGAFKRAGKKRFPIVKLHGLSAWSMMRSKKFNIESKWISRGRERFGHHLDDQVRFRLLRAAGRA